MKSLTLAQSCSSFAVVRLSLSRARHGLGDLANDVKHARHSSRTLIRRRREPSPPCCHRCPGANVSIAHEERSRARLNCLLLSRARQLSKPPVPSRLANLACRPDRGAQHCAFSWVFSKCAIG